MLRTIDREELKTMMDRGRNFVLINVLDRESYENERICGSISIPLPGIKEAVNVIKRDETVVVHCSSPACTASAEAADELNKLGFEDVRRFVGGIKAWKEAGYCLEGNLYEKIAV